MDHLNITQVCIYCSRGQKVFKVDLDLYDDEGRLPIGIDKSVHFQFMLFLSTKNIVRFLYVFASRRYQAFKTLKEAFKRNK